MKLPTPVGRQKEVLYLPAQGHIVVLGTAGSGKTTLAILRSAYLADPQTDHAGRTLLVTFNRALVTYLKHLRERELPNVVVENYHTFARGYLACRGQMSRNAICNPDQRRDLISRAIERVAGSYEPHPFFKKPLEAFSEEIRWIAQHGIRTPEDYTNIERIGRSGTRIPKAHRKIMFEIYESYLAHRSGVGKDYDWDDLASAVISAFDEDTSERFYKHIVIDEGQDFSPEMIRSLTKAIPPDGTITFFGDVAQQIYGHRISWRSAGLNIRSHWEFKENYRNTKQIARLALAISRMPYFRDMPDLVEPLAPAADGPLPTIVKCSSVEEEIELAISQSTKASKAQNIAILFRSREDEQAISVRLPRSSIRLHRDMTTWQAGPGIRYGTYHSAKGLEFDMVILPFCSSQRLPDPQYIQDFGEDDAAINDGRLLYVAVTRAKTRLVITYSGGSSALLPSEDGLYQEIQL